MSWAYKTSPGILMEINLKDDLYPRGMYIPGGRLLENAERRIFKDVKSSCNLVISHSH